MRIFFFISRIGKKTLDVLDNTAWFLYGQIYSLVNVLGLIGVALVLGVVFMAYRFAQDFGVIAKP